MFETSLSASQVTQALYETFVMLGWSLLIGGLWGLVQGTVMVLIRDNGVRPNVALFRILTPIINTLRSVPFIILLIALIPITKFIVGTSIGTMAAVVPLSLCIGPYIGRLVETSLLEVGSGIIETARSLGASTWQIVWHFLLPEARQSLVLNLTTATIGLLGATTMAGAVGAGGVGDLAISYGYQRFDTGAVVITVLILIAIVQAIQFTGEFIAKRLA